MSERTATPAPAQERSRDLAHLPISEQLEAADQAYKNWYVPDVEDIAHYGGLVSQVEIHYVAGGPAYTEHTTGEALDTDHVEQLLEAANPYRWKLGKEDTDYYLDIANARSERNLSGEQNDLFKSFKKSLHPKDHKFAFDDFRKFAGATLDISNELHDIEARNGSLHVPLPVGARNPLNPGQVITSEHDPNDQTPKPVPAPFRGLVGQYAHLDSEHYALRPDGTRMIPYEADLIIQNIDKVVDEIEHRDSIEKRRQQQKQLWTANLGRARYEAKFGNNPAVDPDAYRESFLAPDPDAIVRGRHRPELPEEVFLEIKPTDVEQAFWDKLDGSTKQAWNGNVLPEASKQKLKDYLTHQPAGRQRNQEANDNFAKWYERSIVAGAKELYPKNYRLTPEQRTAIGARANEISDGARIKEYRKAEAERMVETYNKRLEELGSDERLTVAKYNALSNEKLWNLMASLYPQEYGAAAQEKVHSHKAPGAKKVKRPTPWETVGDTNLHWSGEGDLDIPPKVRMHRRVGKAALRAVPFRIVRR
ncbi:hypothetical protein EYC59_00230 [Candidatus Saccharibacteria bacterium]|nr:MAG: hypothetical protein EYC59_00230 [Candidatus Saccharibacteria bacterium]